MSLFLRRNPECILYGTLALYILFFLMVAQNPPDVSPAVAFMGPVLSAIPILLLYGYFRGLNQKDAEAAWRDKTALYEATVRERIQDVVDILRRDTAPLSIADQDRIIQEAMAEALGLRGRVGP